MDWRLAVLTEAVQLLALGSLLHWLCYRLVARYWSGSAVDRHMVSLLLLWLVLTVVPLVLAVVGTLELVGMLLLLGPVYWWAYRRAHGPIPLDVFLQSLMVRALEAPHLLPPGGADRPLQPGAFWQRWRRSLPRLVPALLVGLVLAISLLLRAEDLWQHPAPLFADSLSHLKWVRELQQSRLYTDGVYPLGMHSVISAFHLVLPQDLTVLYRLWGPVSAVCWIGTTMWVAAALTRSWRAGVVAGLIVGWLGTGALGHLFDPLRQMGTLPEEATQLWILPGLWWASQYLREGAPVQGLAVAGATVVTVAGHWGNFGMLLIGLAAVGLAALGTVPLRRIMALGLYAATAAFAGYLPQLVGQLLGRPFGGAQDVFAQGGVPAVPVFVWICAAVAVALLALTFLERFRAWGAHCRWLPAVLLAWMGVWQLWRFWSGPEWVVKALAQRGGSYAAMAAVLVVAFAWGLAEDLLQRYRLQPVAHVSLAVVLAGSLAVLPAPYAYPGFRPLTDETVLAMRSVKEERPRGSFLAIGNRSLLSLCVGECLQWDDYVFADRIEHGPPGADPVSDAVGGFVGSADPQLWPEVLLFVTKDAAPPAGERPGEDGVEQRRWDDQYGAWYLSGWVQGRLAAAADLPVVWEGTELKVYQLLPRGGEPHG